MELFTDYMVRIHESKLLPTYQRVNQMPLFLNNANTSGGYIRYTHATTRERVNSCDASSLTESFGRRCLAWAQSRFSCFSGQNTGTPAALNSRIARHLKSDEVTRQSLPKSESLQNIRKAYSLSDCSGPVDAVAHSTTASSSASIAAKNVRERVELPGSDNQSSDGAPRPGNRINFQWGGMFHCNNENALLYFLFGFEKPKKIQSGRFGTIYQYHDNLGMDFAVKIHHLSKDKQSLACNRGDDKSGDDKTCDKYYKEQRDELVGLSLPRHPNIVTVHVLLLRDTANSCYVPIRDLSDLRAEDYGKFQLRMVISEYVDGYDLVDLLAGCAKSKCSRGRLALAKDLAIQLSDALAFLHAREVIYRDIKPHNVMVTYSENGERIFKLVDFGHNKQLDDRNPTSSNSRRILNPLCCKGFSSIIKKGNRTILQLK